MRSAMADLKQVSEHMEIIGANCVHIGTVDRVEGDRIKMTKADSGSPGDHHHFISGRLVTMASPIRSFDNAWQTP